MAKTYMEMTDAEIEKASKLTPTEENAVNALIASARMFPRSLSIAIDEDEGALVVSKRISGGAAKQVGKLRKRSLVF